MKMGEIHSFNIGDRCFWRVPEFPNYYVSFCGSVVKISSFGKIKELKQKTDANGYKRIALYNNSGRKDFTVHRLVMLVFKGPSSLQVNHKDLVRHNNHIDNLEYVTAKENIRHSFKNNPRDFNGNRNNMALLTKEAVEIIRDLSSKGVSNQELAIVFDVSRRTISDVVRGISWRKTCL